MKGPGRVYSTLKGFGWPLPPIWVGRPRQGRPVIRECRSWHDANEKRHIKHRLVYIDHDGGSRPKTCLKCKKLRGG